MKSLALSLVFCSCLVRDSGAPARPNAVPSSAFWCGGADGGVFVKFSMTDNGKQYQGAVYTDHAGDLLFAGKFRMDPENPGPPPKLSSLWCNGWDGTRLWLRSGGALLAIDADKQVFRPR